MTLLTFDGLVKDHHDLAEGKYCHKQLSLQNQFENSLEDYGE